MTRGRLLLSAKIAIADYDPHWPELFRSEADRIRSLLGGTALQIEHIGSTAIPGLAAKAIIDVLLVVADSSDESAYLPLFGLRRLRAENSRASVVRASHAQGSRCPTSTCTSFRPAALKSSAFCCFAIGFAAIRPTAIFTNAPNATWRCGIGTTCKITPMPKPPYVERDPFPCVPS